MYPRALFRIIAGTLAAALSALVLPAPVLAEQTLVPERRIAISRDVDFYGADLQPVFETSFATCKTICLKDRACKAFTFNFKSNACFPKSEITERRPFEGAASAQVFETDPEVLAGAAKRAGDLQFLNAYYLDEARAQAGSLAEDYITNQWTAEQLTEASRNARTGGNPLNALRFMGAALNLTDQADGWAELALLAQEVTPKDSAEKREMMRVSTAAAINAYLRGRNPGILVSALNILAKGVESRGDGRLSIPVLRLAQSIQPRLDTEQALERAIGLYGFRITDHQVDNNAAEPRICAIFSESLVKAGVDYASFVALPETGLAVEAEDNQVCIDGLSHGETYRLTFRRGLPAASGETLQKPVDLSVYVRDRDPSARFVGRAYILPKGGTATIPIVTVNLAEVDLKIDRVGDRNLTRVMQEGLFARPLSLWDENALANEIGAEIWSGRGEVAREVNRDVTTALPVGEVIAEFEPGVYVMRARVPGADPYDGNAAAQWFIVTDLGLTTMRGGDGLHVFVRSLNSAEAHAGVRVELIATNNTVLGEAMTDRDGYAHFPPGLLAGRDGAAPALVTVADDGGDFAFLSLKDAAFDLSDRGVGGRPAPAPIDLFLTTERGVYRPGETVHALALARDHKALAINRLPLTAIITRPDGVEYGRELLEDQGAGGRVLTLDLPNSAQRGAWNLRLHADPEGAQLASRDFLVEDLIPERIDFDLRLPDGLIRRTDQPIVQVEARYLYGAPGAGLKAEAEARVSLADGLEGYPGYHFGRQDEYVGDRLAFTSVAERTDERGSLDLRLAMPETDDLSRPLKLVALVRLSEGSGRPVERSIERALAPERTLLGVKPLFEGVVPEGGVAGFDVIAVGPSLQKVALGRVGWTLNRVMTRYQWYETDGSWRYEPITTRTRVASGEFPLDGDRAARIEAAVDWGRYELRLETLDGAYLSASYGFHAGWHAPADAPDTPDTLEIGLDKDGYRTGETARLRLVPRHAGIALVSVISNRLIAMKSVAVAEGENLIDLPVTDEWGAGAYVTASVIRPMNVAAGRNPARALGLNWAGVDPGDHRLQAAFTTADEVSPRATMTARLKVEGIRPDETAYAAIAAVDAGILNLTGFKAFDPEGHYFGQQRLGMEIRDVYGRLIDGMLGSPGRLRSGGDGALAGRMEGPPPTEDLVAFFAGPVRVGADGVAEAEFDIPEFNGAIRLMAVVWSDSGVGQASKDVLARDPVVLTASLPRFLAPFDQSRIRLDIAHATGPAGPVTVEIAASGGLEIDRSELPASLVLPENGRLTLEAPVTAPAEGAPEITVVLHTPAGARLEKHLILPIRANDPVIVRSRRLELADRSTFTLSDDVFAGLVPGTGRATLAIGPLARFDAPGLLSALDRYPYGCTEQVASRALPLLYFSQVAEVMGLAEKTGLDKRIEQAIAEVLSNQGANGAFGLWSPGSGDLWLDAYVSDFLSRARARGFAPPDQAFRLAIENLRNRVNYAGDFEDGGADIAYALMVLAREGAANIGDLRYYADVKAEDFATPLALAQLGAALASYGDQTRADRMFAAASALLERRKDQPEEQLLRSDYGTYLRDSAAVLTLAVESRSEAIDQRRLAERITPDATGGRMRSTQENMWSLLAANALIEEVDPGDFLLDGLPAAGPLVRVLEAGEGDRGEVRFANQSGKSADLVLTTIGVPAEPEPAGGNGYRIDRFYFTPEGEPVTAGRIALNQRLVVVLKITPERYSEARLIVDDPLPAGLEIDNPNLLKAGDVKALDWLDLNAVPSHAEFRAERFIAALDWSSEKPFQLAYMVRAISPGRFHHPAASVEDMYRPEYRARTAVGRVQVAAE